MPFSYSKFSKPYTYNVNYVSQFMHSPAVAHWKLVQHILSYLKGTITIGLHLSSTTTFTMHAFYDVDWASCPTTQWSTIGYCTFLGSNLVSWCAKKQHTISQSSTKAEYRVMANTVVELTWLSFILKDLHISLSSPPVLHCDNISVLYMTINLVFHARSKHIELDYHFICGHVALGLLVTKHVPSANQVADSSLTLSPKLYLLSFSSNCAFSPGSVCGGILAKETTTLSAT